MTNKICVMEDKQHGTYHPVLFYPSPKPSEHNDEYWRHYSYAHLTNGFTTLIEAVQWAHEHANDDDNLEYINVTIACDGVSDKSMVYYFKR